MEKDPQELFQKLREGIFDKVKDMLIEDLGDEKIGHEELISVLSALTVVQADYIKSSPEYAHQALLNITISNLENVVNGTMEKEEDDDEV